MDNFQENKMLSKEEIIDAVVMLNSNTLDQEQTNDLFHRISDSIKPFVTQTLSENYNSLLSECADELFQEVNMALWKNLHSFDPKKGNFFTFIRPLVLRAAQEYENKVFNA